LSRQDSQPLRAHPRGDQPRVQIARIAPLVDPDRDKPTVIALREVALGKVGIEMLLKGQS
jgi:hypothetical protein